MAERYDPSTIEARWQQVWSDERTWEVSNEPDERPKGYVLEMLPYTERRAAHRPLEELRARRRDRALLAPHRPSGAAPDGLRRLRAPGGEPRHQDGPAPARVHRGVDRAVPQGLPLLGGLDRLDPRVRHARAPLLPLDAVDLPPPLRARPRLPQGGGGQVVPQGRHRARQRAGDRRPLRALRHGGGGPAARAVVLPHHGYADRLLEDMRTDRVAARTWSRCRRTGSAAPRAPR